MSYWSKKGTRVYGFKQIKGVFDSYKQSFSVEILCDSDATALLTPGETLEQIAREYIARNPNLTVTHSHCAHKHYTRDYPGARPGATVEVDATLNLDRVSWYAVRF